MIILWLITAWSILLMSPKGWLGMGIGGMSSNHEYGSKKSISGILKKSATIAGTGFVIICLLYPFL